MNQQAKSSKLACWTRQTFLGSDGCLVKSQSFDEENIDKDELSELKEENIIVGRRTRSSSDVFVLYVACTDKHLTPNRRKED